MKSSRRIIDVNALEILDSRGNPTVQVEVKLEDGSKGVSMVPSGASTGSFEAIELRDSDKSRYLGKGVTKAIENVNNIIKNEILGMDGFEQVKLDKKLIEIDGTENKSKLGANATLGVSLATAKAVANSLGIELFRYLGGTNAKIMPVPMMNIMNGGKHADSSLSIQEFMIMPINAKSFREALRIGTEVYHSLKKVLNENGYSTSIGDEGGFAPKVKNEDEALFFIKKAIENIGLIPGKDIAFALDVAATEMYSEAEKIGENGKYCFWKSGIIRTTENMIDFYEELIKRYPIISIEDGLAEEDWEGWKKLTSRLSERIQLVGDDLFVTNIDRIKRGISSKVANAVLIKPNQIGTLTETLDAIEITKKSGMKAIISHRSGETEDTTIADIAVALNLGQIKTGAPCRIDRVAKYNRILNIENELKENAYYYQIEQKRHD